jgi:hypothetical protein
MITDVTMGGSMPDQDVTIRLSRPIAILLAVALAVVIAAASVFLLRVGSEAASTTRVNKEVETAVLKAARSQFIKTHTEANLPGVRSFRIVDEAGLSAAYVKRPDYSQEWVDQFTAGSREKLADDAPYWVVVEFTDEVLAALWKTQGASPDTVFVQGIAVSLGSDPPRTKEYAVSIKP